MVDVSPWRVSDHQFLLCKQENCLSVFKATSQAKTEVIFCDKKYMNVLTQNQNMQHVVLCNRPTLSIIGMERLV